MRDLVSMGWVRTTSAAASLILVAVVLSLAGPPWGVAALVFAGVGLAVLGGLHMAGRSDVSVQRMIADLEAGPRPAPAARAPRKP